MGCLMSMMVRVWTFLVLGVVACTGMEAPPPGSDGSSDGITMDATMTMDGGLAPFGASCTVASRSSTECQGGVCFSFGSSGLRCTQTCTMGMMGGGADPSCPVGSEGQKCNRDGVCRP